MPVTLEDVAEPPGIEFRTLPNRFGRISAVRVARSDLSILADYFEHRYGLAGTADMRQRLAAALEALADCGEIKIQYVSNHEVLARYCRRASVRYEHFWFDTERWRRIRRTVPLFLATEPNGFLRTLHLSLDEPDDDPETTPGLTLREEFSDPAAREPHDSATGYSNDLTIDYADLPALAALGPNLYLTGGQRPDEQAEALMTALLATGQLGPHLEPGGNRERLVAWCHDAGIHPRLHDMLRRHRILEVDDLRLELWFWNTHGRSRVEFTEAYPTGDLGTSGTRYHVSFAWSDALPLTAYLEHQLGLAPAEGRLDDRVIACFDALAAQDHLNPQLPRQGNRAVVAQWITAAGLTPTLRGFVREELLLSAYRRDTDCDFTLTLTMDATAPGNSGVVFREDYEYLPQPGDAGREYAYLVKTPYTSLPALVAHLESHPGVGGLEERLARCFHDLVARGDLHAGLDTEEAANLVANWFNQAAVPTERDFSQWVNSD